MPCVKDQQVKRNRNVDARERIHPVAEIVQDWFGQTREPAAGQGLGKFQKPMRSASRPHRIANESQSIDREEAGKTLSKTGPVADAIISRTRNQVVKEKH